MTQIEQINDTVRQMCFDEWLHFTEPTPNFITKHVEDNDYGMVIYRYNLEMFDFSFDTFVARIILSPKHNLLWSYKSEYQYKMPHGELSTWSKIQTYMNSFCSDVQKCLSHKYNIIHAFGFGDGNMRHCFVELNTYFVYFCGHGS